MSTGYRELKQNFVIWIIGLSKSLTLTTWILERLNVEDPHIRIAWSQLIKHLFSCITLVMYDASNCFKVLPANQPSEARLERRGNAFPVPSSAPVAEELLLTLKLLTLDGTHRSPHRHTDCKLTQTVYTPKVSTTKYYTVLLGRKTQWDYDINVW